MKRILATTALVALTAVPAFAQTDTTTTTTSDTTMSQNDTMGGGVELNGLQISADDMIGRTVYASSVAGAGTGDAVVTEDSAAATDGTMADDEMTETDGVMGEDDVAGMDQPADDWENIGSVNDVLFSAEGDIEAVVLDIGGFLGIGAREVGLTMDQLTLINDTANDGEFFVVYNGSADELEQVPEMDRDSMTEQGSTFQTGANTGAGTNVVTDDAGTDDMASDEMAADDMATDDMATDDMAAEDEAPLAQTTAQDTSPATGTDDLVQEGGQEPLVAEETTTMDPADDSMAMGEDNYLTDDDRAALTAEDLIGTDVHDMNDNNVGTIDDIVLTAEGGVSDVIVDVGGFLGIGARSVALSFDDLQIARDEGAMTTSLRAVTSMTEEELENMPEWTNN